MIQYCNNFQAGKCRFGERCKYKHEINPDFKKKKIIVDDRKKSNIITSRNKDKIHFKKKNSNTSTSHNNITGPHRDRQVEGQPPKYSNQRHIAIRNFSNANDISGDQFNNNNNNNNNNSNCLFFKTSNTTDTNPRMYVLKEYADNVDIPDTNYFT